MRDCKPAINWMKRPERGVLKNNMRDDDVCRVLEFDETRSGKLYSSMSPHVPPRLSLAINCAISS